jgi:hypothetical protein
MPFTKNIFFMLRVFGQEKLSVFSMTVKFSIFKSDLN